MALPCPCHDPVVFGHVQPCPRWETASNNRTPVGSNGRQNLTRAFQCEQMDFTVTETAEAIRRLARTVDQFNLLMREVNATYSAETPASRPPEPDPSSAGPSSTTNQATGPA